MDAVLIHKYGGPEELQYEEVEIPEITSDEILVKGGNYPEKHMCCF